MLSATKNKQEWDGGFLHFQSTQTQKTDFWVVTKAPREIRKKAGTRSSNHTAFSQPSTGLKLLSIHLPTETKTAFDVRVSLRFSP